MNNRVRVAIVVWPWGTYLGDDGLSKGIRAQVSSWIRMSARSFCRARIRGQYVNSIMAKREAILGGYEKEFCWTSKGLSPRGPARTSSWSAKAKS